MTFSKNSGVMVLPSRSTPSPSIQNTGILPFTPSAPQQMSHVSGFLICSAASTCGCAGRISNGSASTRGKPCHRSLAALNPKPLTRPLPKIDFARGQRRPGAPPLRRAPAGGGASGARRAARGGGRRTLLGLEILDGEVERGRGDLDGRARRLQRLHLGAVLVSVRGVEEKEPFVAAVVPAPKPARRSPRRAPAGARGALGRGGGRSCTRPRTACPCHR